MFDVAGEINWVVVLGATVAYFMLGALWFTPLFGKAYDKATGVERSAKQKWPPIYYYAPFLSSLVATIAITIVIHAMDVQNATDAGIVGLLFGISIAGVSFSNAVAPNMPRPILFGVVVGGYHLVSALMVSIIVFNFG